MMVVMMVTVTVMMMVTMTMMVMMVMRMAMTMVMMMILMMMMMVTMMVTMMVMMRPAGHRVHEDCAPVEAQWGKVKGRCTVLGRLQAPLVSAACKWH